MNKTNKATTDEIREANDAIKAKAEVNEITETTEVTEIAEETALTTTNLGTAINLEQVFSTQNALFSTFKGEGSEVKISIAKAMETENKLSSMVGKTINWKDFIAYPVDMIDKDTGEVSVKIRSIIIDADGSAYASVSNIIAKDINRLFSIFGYCGTWDKPLAITVKMHNPNPKSVFYTLGIA